MNLSCQNNHWCNSPTRSINAFYNCDPFCISRLCNWWSSFCLSTCNNLACCCSSHLKPCFIKVVDICCHNAILLNGILHTFEPFLNKNWIVAQCTLIIQATAKLGFQCCMPFYKVGDPAFANSSLWWITLRKQQVGHICNHS